MSKRCNAGNQHVLAITTVERRTRMKYKSGDLCVIHSKTSSNNGKVVEVVDKISRRMLVTLVMS